MIAAQLDGGAQSLIGERGRHPHVHDGHVGPVRGDRGDQGAWLVHRGRDLVPAVFEQPAQALTEQGRVLGDHNPHASDAFTRAGAARR